MLCTLCRTHRVKALYLFGSATREDFDPQRSDLDFLVEFESLPKGQRADAYFGLREDLVRLFGRPVDLVTVMSIRSPYVADSVNQSRIPLYAAA